MIFNRKIFRMSKNILIAFTIIASIIGCGESSSNKQPSSATANFDNPVYQEGLALVAKSNCLTCHQVMEQATGPSYSSIAQKYADDTTTVNLLSSKIINGGVGVWGQVPMTAHPNISKADAEKMVKYILLLKK